MAPGRPGWSSTVHIRLILGQHLARLPLDVRGPAGREAMTFDVRHLDALGELALVRDEGVGGDDEVRDHPQIYHATWILNKTKISLKQETPNTKSNQHWWAFNYK